MKASPVYIVLVMVIIAASGCRKQPLPPATPQDPVFSFTGDFRGEPLRLEAGNDDYYMYSSHSRDTDNVVIFTGELARTGCPAECGYRLAVMIRDAATSQQGSPVNADIALKPGVYPFYDHNQGPVEYTTVFRPSAPFDPAGTYSWTILDEAGIVYQGSTYDCSMVLSAFTTYTATLSYLDASGCSVTHTNIHRPSSVLQTTVSSSLDTSQPDITYKFSCNTPADSYYWEFPFDGSTSTQWQPTKQFDVKPGEYYEVRLRITKGTDTLYTNYQVPAVKEAVCLANFSQISTPLPVPVAFSRVTVQLTDPSGKVFSSSGFTQPQESQFRILASENYKVNEKNESTRRLKLSFNCQLRHGTEQAAITNGEAVIAVSYP